MTDYGLYVAVIATVALAVECANTVGIAYGVHWMLASGKNIVGKIAQAIGLQRGKDGSILDQIKSWIPKAGAIDNNGGDDQEINLGELGTFTPSQLQGMAKQFLGKGKTGIAPQGVDILQKLASGKDVNMMEGLPWLYQLLMQPNQQNLQQSQQSSHPPGFWDS